MSRRRCAPGGGFVNRPPRRNTQALTQSTTRPGRRADGIERRERNSRQRLSSSPGRGGDRSADPGRAGHHRRRVYAARLAPIVGARLRGRGIAEALRILGEDLVIFRDRSNVIGLLHKNYIYCGASLELLDFPAGTRHYVLLSRWHFDTNGRILGVGAEPETSRIPTNFGQGAYPVKEAHGLIYLYGPAGADTGNFRYTTRSRIRTITNSSRSR